MKNWLFLGILLVLSSCASNPEVIDQDVPIQEALPWVSVASLQGDAVNFSFNPAALMEGQDLPESVSLAGTFTHWKNDAAFGLTLDPISGIWKGSFPLKIIDVPGNSGMPEFQFVVNYNSRIGGNVAPLGECWGSNFVVIVPPETTSSLAEKDLLNKKLRAEWETQEMLSNFRTLSGGSLGNGILNRSYHPFVPSKGYPGEKERLLAVQKLMETRGINTIINLTDSPGIANSAQVSPYYKTVIDKGNVDFVVTEYNTVYYEPDQGEFAGQIKEIFSFMWDHEGPYLIHCRLGTDRTGVITAILEAFSGVGWESIKVDYELSNLMGIKEYRSTRLLEYSFTKMLGKKPGESKDLAADMRIFLVKSGIAEETLNKVLKNLTQVP